MKDYESKYKNRQLKVMALFGHADLCLDKKHLFTVSTGQASLLLKIAEMDTTLETVAEYMQIDLQTIEILLAPMLLTNLVIKDG
jgi:hypothetical protein